MIRRCTETDATSIFHKFFQIHLRLSDEKKLPVDRDFGIQFLSYFWSFFVLDLYGGSGLNVKSMQGISLIIAQLAKTLKFYPEQDGHACL